MKYFTAIAVGAALLTGVAANTDTATLLTKRRDDASVSCSPGKDCTSYYGIAKGDCDAGYQKITFQEKGNLGISCFKKCSDDEKAECLRKRCAVALGTCTQYPANEACKDAMESCNGKPIKTTKDVCTEKFMENAVVYDDASGTCSYDPNTKPKFDKASEDTTFKFEYVKSKLDLVVTCRGLTEKGKTNLKTIAYGLQCKPLGKTAYLCRIGDTPSRAPDKLHSVVEKACLKQSPAPGKKISFESDIYPADE